MKERAAEPSAGKTNQIHQLKQSKEYINVQAFLECFKKSELRKHKNDFTQRLKLKSSHLLHQGMWRVYAWTKCE